MSKQAIPAELKALKQWVVVGNKKVPLQAATGAAADVMNPEHWASFDNAVAAAGSRHVGLVLTAGDPYALLDLDAGMPADRQQQIAARFNSYTEQSQSGKGLHVIFKTDKQIGRRKGAVELYTHSRYAIMTGVIVSHAPVREASDAMEWALDNLLDADEKAALKELNDTAESSEDAQLLSKLFLDARFTDLYSNDIQDYESASEADYALLGMLSAATDSDTQVVRLFKNSARGQRKKANRVDYLRRSLQRLRASEPQELEAQPAVKVAESQAQGYSFPPGRAGRLVEYLRACAIRPLEEVALCATLAVLSGMCGRNFNVSKTGLNLYMVLVGRTGIGKEGAAASVEHLFSVLEDRLPNVYDYLGPAHFASGPALVRCLTKKPVFISFLGEFGLTLQQMCSRKADNPQVSMRKMLLAIYSKSGSRNTLQPSVYADAAKNTAPIRSPAVSFLGDATPASFFDCLDNEQIEQGLVPRLSIVHCNKRRPPYNDQPPPELPSDIQLAFEQICEAYQDFVDVDMAEGAQLLNEFNGQIDSTMNASEHEISLQMWNRGHLKALKIAALLAVFENPSKPQITAEQAQWAIDFVRKEVSESVARFESGSYGGGEAQQDAQVLDACAAYMRLSATDRMKYGIGKKLAKVQAVPFSYLSRRLKKTQAFTKDRKGPRDALVKALQGLERTGQLRAVKAPEDVKTKVPLYQLSAD